MPRAASVGAEVRLRRAGELAPREVIDQSPSWRRHLASTEGIPVATAADLVWADGIALGSLTSRKP